MNLSFIEILFILILALLFFKPEDLPIIAKRSKEIITKILELRSSIFNEIEDIESQIEQDLKQNNKIIPEQNDR